MEILTWFSIISALATETLGSKLCFPEYGEDFYLKWIKSCLNDLPKCRGGLSIAVNTSKNHCNPDSCDRGTCSNGTSSYLCDCFYGYAGKNCSEFDSNITEPLLTINGTHYRVTKRNGNIHSWNDSREKCKKIGGDLAAAGLRNDTIRENVYKYLKESNNSPFIGLTKSKEDDMWYWIDGVKAWKNSSFWWENRPQSNQNHHCAILHKQKKGKITNQDCSKQNSEGLCAFNNLSLSLKTDV